MAKTAIGIVSILNILFTIIGFCIFIPERLIGDFASNLSRGQVGGLVLISVAALLGNAMSIILACDENESSRATAKTPQPKTDFVQESQQ